jgi:hypothetical protein
MARYNSTARAFEDCTKFSVVTQALKDHGFSDTDVRKAAIGCVRRKFAQMHTKLCSPRDCLRDFVK